MNRKNVKLIHTNPRPTDIRHGYADISKAKRILGFHPKVPLQEGLIKLVNWYAKQNRDSSATHNTTTDNTQATNNKTIRAKLT